VTALRLVAALCARGRFADRSRSDVARR